MFCVPSTRSLLRDASLPALDPTFLPVSGIAYAIVWHGAYAVRTTTHAHRHASGTRAVADVVRVAGIAGALIRPGASAVQARVLAHILATRATHVVPNAPSGIGIDAESWIADAHVRPDASAVRPAAVSTALRRVGRGRRDGDAPAGIGVDGESRLAGTPIVPDAHAVRATAVSAIADGVRRRSRRHGDASTGVGVDVVSKSALRRTRTRDASAAVTILRVPGSASANVWRDAFAVVATARAIGNAGLAIAGWVGVSLVAGTHARPAAYAVHAAALARGHALLAFIQNVSRPAAADARRHALAVGASVRADRSALAVASLVVAQFAHAHLGREAVGVLLALIRTNGHANAVLGTPSGRAAADVRTCAVAAETTAVASRLAQATRHVALVAVATVQDSDPTVIMGIVAPGRLRNGIVRRSAGV